MRPAVPERPIPAVPGAGSRPGTHPRGLRGGRAAGRETGEAPVAGVAAGGWRPALMRERLGPADSVGTAVDLALCQTHFDGTTAV
jgi:hypothetical protein